MENNGFTVKDIPGKGKGLVATKNFEEDDIIFKEEPLVSCQFSWNKAYGYLACDHCLKPLETAERNARRLTAIPNYNLPYPECGAVVEIVECECGVKYCSAECKVTASERYHETICSLQRGEDSPLEKLDNVWKQMHYPPETSTIMLLARLIAVIHQAANPEETLATVLGFHHDTHNHNKAIYKMLEEKFIPKIDLLHKIFSDALHFAGNSSEVFFTPTGFRSLLALVGMNSQGIGTSPLIPWYDKCCELLENASQNAKDKFEASVDALYRDAEKHAGSFINSEGSGLYVLQRKANHSCDANANVSFPDNNHCVYLKATKKICVGDEICINYLDECQQQSSRHSRQKFLLENYLFLCLCSKCEEQSGDPDVTSEEEMDDEDDDDDEEMDD